MESTANPSSTMSSSSSPALSSPQGMFADPTFLREVNEQSRRVRENPAYRDSEEYKEFIKRFQDAILSMSREGNAIDGEPDADGDEKEKEVKSPHNRLVDKMKQLRGQRTRKLSEKEMIEREERIRCKKELKERKVPRGKMKKEKEEKEQN